MEKYVYRRLSGKRNTRLLHLQSSRNFQAPLRCHLTEGSFKDDELVWDSKPYEALSYVWGSPSAPHFVEVEGKHLPVTANCELALRYLRHSSHSRILWVDAICIDQAPEAIEERNSQVAMMGEIYSTAKTVLIWLGEGHQWAQDFFGFLGQVSRGEIGDLAQKIKEGINSEVIGGTPEGKYGVQLQGGAKDVLCRPWFERMWTLQELMLSQKCIVIFSHHSIPWDEFHSAALESIDILDLENHVRPFQMCSVAWKSYGGDRRTSSQRNSSLLSRIGRPIWREKRAKETKPHGFPAPVNELWTLYASTRIRKANEPKDKIFALYSMARFICAEVSRPDYSKSTSEVYLEATLASLNNDSSGCELFRFIWSPVRPSDLPSWVPNFEDTSFHELEISDQAANWVTCERTRYKTSGNGKKLHLTGITLGTILSVAESFISDFSTMTEPMLHFNRWLQSPDISQGKQPTIQYLAKYIGFLRRSMLLAAQLDTQEHPERSLAALYTTLVIVNGIRSNNNIRAGFSIWRKLLLPEFEEFRKPLVALGRQLLGLFFSPREAAELAGDPDAIVTVLVFWLPRAISLSDWSLIEAALPWNNWLQHGMSVFSTLFAPLIYETLFTTGTGHLGISYGPRSEGEHIVAFAHCPVLVILSTEGREYRLQSPTYVHGISRPGKDLEQKEYVLI